MRNGSREESHPRAARRVNRCRSQLLPRRRRLGRADPHHSIQHCETLPSRRQRAFIELYRHTCHPINPTPANSPVFYNIADVVYMQGCGKGNIADIRFFTIPRSHYIARSFFLRNMSTLRLLSRFNFFFFWSFTGLFGAWEEESYGAYFLPVGVLGAHMKI